MKNIKTFLKKLYRVWMKFAEALGYVNARILLTLVYFIIMPWIAIPQRILNKKDSTPNWNPAEFKLAQVKNIHYQF